MFTLNLRFVSLKRVCLAQRGCFTPETSDLAACNVDTAELCLSEAILQHRSQSRMCTCRMPHRTHLGRHAGLGRRVCIRAVCIRGVCIQGVYTGVYIKRKKHAETGLNLKHAAKDENMRRKMRTCA